MRLALLLLTLSGCSKEPHCVLRGGFQRRYALNTFLLPKSRMDFALDLNGDGKRDDQLGNVLSAAELALAMSQQHVNQAIADGSFKPIITLTSTDPEFALAQGAAVTFSDGGRLGTFCGHLGPRSFLKWSGLTSEFTPELLVYVSDDGISEERPVELSLTLPFFDNAALPITAARIMFTIDGKAIAGQINGGVRAEDFDRIAIPGIASRLNDKVAAAPTELNNMQILSLFDTGGADEGCNGGCRNPDGSCGARGNGKIELCEISTNSIIKNVLAPDVALFDYEGRYRPDVFNRGKDCMSMGAAFTAVEVP